MKKMYDNINQFSEDDLALVLPDAGSASLAQIPTAQTITPDYFVQHYHEFLPRYIANGNPTSKIRSHNPANNNLLCKNMKFCKQTSFFCIKTCIFGLFVVSLQAK